VKYAMELRVLSVNVGQPKQIGMRDGKPLMSAIGKESISAQMIMARALGLDGDAQANLVAHGGVDKAVYAYPSDHWSWWQSEKNFPCAPARFGENLTLQGADEDAVAIGDRFSWGGAVVEISQPRSPCNKFQIYSGRLDIPALMTISGRCGWYLRVVQEGDAPTDGTMERVSQSGGPSVRETFWAAFKPKFDPARKAEIAIFLALAKAWHVKMYPETKG
jgi:MOSC domain-containing protein YiiM